MSRPPWRVADIGDAIIGRSTRPSLPAGVLLSGGPDDPTTGIDLTGVDEVWVIAHETSQGIVMLVWPMKLGEPWFV